MIECSYLQSLLTPVSFMIKDYSTQNIADLLSIHYGISPQISLLGGYTDRNYLLIDPLSSLKLILKISSKAQSQPLIQLQNYVLRRLKTKQLVPGCSFPTLLPTLEGKDMFVTEEGSSRNYFRVLNYVEGKEMWDFNVVPESILSQVGQVTAKVSLELQAITQEYGIQESIKNDSQKYYLNILNFLPTYNSKKQYLDQDIRELVEAAKQDFLAVQPIFKRIPWQFIHNDICPSNLILRQDVEQGLVLSGLIDFSSLIYAPSTMELAIPCARINLDQQQPLKNMLKVVEGYTKHRKLTQDDRTLLYPLIKIRLAFLCLTSCEKVALNKQSQYVMRCKEGVVHYLKVIAQASTNQQFAQVIQDY